MPARETRTGFTLHEALAGLTLAAVLIAGSMIQLPPVLHAVRLSGAGRTVGTALRLARGRAIASNTEIEVRFDGLRGTLETRERAGATLETRSLPAGVGFTGLPARGRITFGALGTAENGTITLAAGRGIRRVVVNQRGRVRVQ